MKKECVCVCVYLYDIDIFEWRSGILLFTFEMILNDCCDYCDYSNEYFIDSD